MVFAALSIARVTPTTSSVSPASITTIWTEPSQARQHPWHQQWQVLADQAGAAEAVGGLRMQPDGRTGGFPALHALPHQTCHHARQHVAGAGRAEPGGGV